MIFSLSFLLPLLITSYATAEADSSENAVASDVVVLTVENFERETQATTGATTGDWLIEFYAPWCGHCKHLQPVWEELATELKGKVNVGKVDVTANRDLGTRFDIKGFPTIKFFQHGKIYDYSGRRTKEAFVDYVSGGYKSSSSSEVPAMPTMIEQLQKTVTEPFKAAYQDITKGRYTTPNVFLVAMPLFVVIVLTIAILVIPDADAPIPKKSSAPAKGGSKKD